VSYQAGTGCRKSQTWTTRGNLLAYVILADFQPKQKLYYIVWSRWFWRGYGSQWWSSLLFGARLGCSLRGKGGVLRARGSQQLRFAYSRGMFHITYDVCSFNLHDLKQCYCVSALIVQHVSSLLLDLRSACVPPKPRRHSLYSTVCIRRDSDSKGEQFPRRGSPSAICLGLHEWEGQHTCTCWCWNGQPVPLCASERMSLDSWISKGSMHEMQSFKVRKT